MARTFGLFIECDNAAFDDESARFEVARLLRIAAERIEGGADSAKLYDVNGNKVGSFNLDEAEGD